MSSGSSTSFRASTPGRVLLGLALLVLWAGANRIWLASEGLENEHYVDELYTVRNTRALIAGGSFEPNNYYYTSLSYLPQAALFATIEAVASLFDDQPFRFFANGRLDPEGYRLARLVQIGYGMGTLLLLFLLGRRLFSVEVGLLAALLLAVTPMHIRLSTIWKPDILLLLIVLMTLLWSLDALDRPTLGRYVRTGCGVGLALAAKLNGGPIAVPLAIGSLVTVGLEWRSRRRPAAAGDAGSAERPAASAPPALARSHLIGLIAAGAASIAMFLLFNPNVGRYLRALGNNQRLYAGRLEEGDLTLGERLVSVPAEAAGLLLEGNFHGTALGVVAFAGMLAIALIAARRRDRPNALRALAVLVFPLAYTVIYAALTAYVKPNNFMQLLPFTSLAAAFLLTEAWALVAHRLPAAARRPAAWAAAGAFVIAVAVPAQVWIYLARVPTTWDVAIAALTDQLKPWDGRAAYIEAPRRTLATQTWAARRILKTVDDLAALPSELLDQSDAEAFPASRLEGERGALYRSRVERAGAPAARFEPRWFRAHGPTVLTLVHSKQLVEISRAAPMALGDGRFRFDLPARPGEWYSVKVSVARRRSLVGAAGESEPTVVVGERSLRLDPRPSGTTWVSERFPSDGQPLIVGVTPGIRAGDIKLAVLRWR